MAGKDHPDLDRKVHPYVFSASQLETADMCLRKWAFDKIDRIPREEKESTILGSEVHDHLERYLKDAVPIDTKIRSGKIAYTALDHIPIPKQPGMQVEEWFVRKRGEVTYWGKKDAQLKEGDSKYRGPVVYDHKTSGSFSWAKSEEDLVEGIQSGMYAWDVMEETGATEAQLRWTYMRTKGKAISLPVITNISREDAEAVMRRVDGISDEMVQLLKVLEKGEAIEAPANFSVCEAYGGCSYKHLCNPSAIDALNAIMEQKVNESLLADLKNRKKKATAEGGAPAVEKAKAVEKVKEEDREETQDQVNPPERGDTPPPPPPEAKKAGGKWFQPAWNEEKFQWDFSAEYKAAVEEELAAAKAAEKAAEKAEKAAEKSNKSSSKASSSFQGSPAADILETIIEMIATRVAEKLSK